MKKMHKLNEDKIIFYPKRAPDQRWWNKKFSQTLGRITWTTHSFRPFSGHFSGVTLLSPPPLLTPLLFRIRFVHLESY